MANLNLERPKSKTQKTKLDLKSVTKIDFSKKFLAEDPKKGGIRNNINHICVSNNFLNQLKIYEIGAWSYFTKQGKFMYDYNEVYIEFEI